MVAGIYCRGEDPAFFSPRRIFSKTNVYICSRMQRISVGFTSCGLLLAKEECRISSFCSCLLVLANVKVNEPTTVRYELKF